MKLVEWRNRIFVILILEICLINIFLTSECNGLNDRDGDSLDNFNLHYHYKNDGFLYKVNNSLVKRPSGTAYTCEGDIYLNVTTNTLSLRYVLKDQYESPTIYYFNEIYFFNLIYDLLYYENGTFFGKSLIFLGNLSYQVGSLYELGALGDAEIAYYFAGDSSLAFQNGTYIPGVSFRHPSLSSHVYYYQEYPILFRGLASYWDPIFEEKFPEYTLVPNSKIILEDISLPIHYEVDISYYLNILQYIVVIAGVILAFFVVQRIIVKKMKMRNDHGQRRLRQKKQLKSRRYEKRG